MEHFSATVILVIITCIISYQAFNQPHLIERYKHYPVREAGMGEFYRLLSAGFLHGGWLHLLINMFVLWMFGEIVENMYKVLFGNTLGVILYVVMYLSCIAVANVGTFFKHRNNPSFASIGASGAVSGVVFIYILADPWALLYLYGLIPIPGIIAGVLFLWYSSWAGKRGGDLIDHDAHYYGAVYGVAFTILLNPGMLWLFFENLFAGIN
ncbi:MAG: rhomboid family intramembrane serine protease [Saprospirales bacterium]|nr:MAG: rhomboid family intramembrane serine protease [Saprospirales bacterium]